MIDCVRRLQRYRNHILAGAFAAALLCVAPPSLHAQEPILTPRLLEASLFPANGPAAPAPPAVDTLMAPGFAQEEGDVLTPNKRQNTPDIKVGLRAGINRSSYTNDRYLDNVLLDVGNVSGETDIYSSAAGFGYTVGADVEYPYSQFFGILVTGEYQRVSFGSKGAVHEPCQRTDGSTGDGNSIHDFRAVLDFIRIAASAKLTLSTWYLTAGFSAAHPISTSLERTKRLGGSDCFFPNSGGKNTIEESGEIPSTQRLHYALRLGGGIIYRITDRFQFSPELTLDFGFNALNKSPNADLGVYGISATIRYDLR